MTLKNSSKFNIKKIGAIFFDLITHRITVAVYFLIAFLWFVSSLILFAGGFDSDHNDLSNDEKLMNDIKSQKYPDLLCLSYTNGEPDGGIRLYKQGTYDVGHTTENIIVWYKADGPSISSAFALDKCAIK